MGQIALEGMEFFAYHGFTDEEQQTGNKYNVDVFIETDLHKSSISDNLNDTIDYSVIYTIVKTEMQIKSRLLEHIGYRIIEQIKARFSSAEKIQVQVSKFNPPVGGIVFRSKITVEDK